MSTSLDLSLVAHFQCASICGGVRQCLVEFLCGFVLAHTDSPWLTLACTGSPWLTLTHAGSLWLTPAQNFFHCNVLCAIWLTLSQTGSQWLTLAHCGSLWLPQQKFWLTFARQNALVLIVGLLLETPTVAEELPPNIKQP